MNIRDALRGGYQPEKVRQGNLRETEKSGPGGGARAAGSADEVQAPEDRVEISASARAALSGPAEGRELAFARKALLSIPPLSQDRLNDILQRVQEGYYSQPDVLDLVSERLAEQFSRGPVE